MPSFKEEIARLRQGQTDFASLALQIFYLQAAHNPIYKRFLQLIGCEPFEVNELTQIPFLPISFFKTKSIKTGDWRHETHFESSGTSGQMRSRHFIKDMDWYEKISAQIFSDQIANIPSLVILGLLPTYTDNPHSSLIAMVKAFGAQTDHPVLFSGLDFMQLKNNLETARKTGKQILLFSVTYALLRLIREGGWDLSDCIVVETGGMKGLETGMVKEEIIDQLKTRLQIKTLFSEYGMTELQSQAYAEGLVYRPGFSMQVLMRDLDDPLGELKKEGRGALNIIDLANFSTCSFIATDDLGQLHADGTFEVFGRCEDAEVRGCNLLFA